MPGLQGMRSLDDVTRLLGRLRRRVADAWWAAAGKGQGGLAPGSLPRQVLEAAMGELTQACGCCALHCAALPLAHTRLPTLLCCFAARGVLGGLYRSVPACLRCAPCSPSGFTRLLALAAQVAAMRCHAVGLLVPGSAQLSHACCTHRPGALLYEPSSCSFPTYPRRRSSGTWHSSSPRCSWPTCSQHCRPETKTCPSAGRALQRTACCF